MRSFLLFALLACALSQVAYPMVRPTHANGIDFINLESPALSFIANLVYVPKSTTGPGGPALWFTADKSNPNVWITRFNASAKAPNDWWFEAGGNVFQVGTSTPHIAFDIVGDNLYGISLPGHHGTNNADAYDTALEFSYYSGTKGGKGGAPVNVPGYSFHSIVMSQTKQPDGHYLGYLTGWADDNSTGTANQGFFIARVSTTTGAGSNPQIDVTKNVLSIVSQNPSCYDLFTTVNKPQMWLDDQFLYVAVTGRCALLIRVTLPGILKPFNTALFQVEDPFPGVDEYLSSATRDSGSNFLYVAVQNYDRKVKTQIASFNLATMMRTNAPVLEIDSQGQAKTLLSFGQDGTDKNLYIFSSGSTAAYRYTADANGALTLYGTASLPENFRTIGDIKAIGSYVYFTTYRSDAAIARMTNTGSFCKTPCDPVNGFCELGSCSCQPPWKKVYALNGTLTCENGKIYDYIDKEVANEAAAVGFGVLFAFALVAALAGWYMWWRGKTTAYQTL